MHAQGLLLFSIHNISSYVCLGALATHVLLHGKYLLGLLRKLKSVQMRELGTAACRFAAGATALILLYSAAYLALHDRESDPHVRPRRPEEIHADAPNPPSDSDGAFPFAAPDDAEAGETRDAPEDADARGEVPTLEAYLADQTCSVCGRRCSLLEPGCRKGQARQAQAKDEYARIYGAEKE